MQWRLLPCSALPFAWQTLWISTFQVMAIFPVRHPECLSRGMYLVKKAKCKATPTIRPWPMHCIKRVFEGPGATDIALRQAMAKRAAGGPAVVETAYDELARQIGEAAWKVTDEQVKKVVQQTGNEKAAFELIVAAALGAGFYRWEKRV